MRLNKESIYEDENPYFKGPSIEVIKKRAALLPLSKRFLEAIDNNSLWLVKQCLEDGIDPSAGNNWAIRWAATSDGNIEIVKELLKDKRVRDKLTNEEKIKYQKFIKESLYEDENPYFKGPSRERIEKATVNMSLEERFEKAIENNVLWLLEECIKKGADLFHGLWVASENDNSEITKIILDKILDYDGPINYNLISEVFNRAVIYDNIDLIKILTGDDYMYLFRHIKLYHDLILYAIDNGDSDMVKFLLDTGRFDPSIYDNESIRMAYNMGMRDIVYYLLRFDDVKNSLTNEEIQKYIKM